MAEVFIDMAVSMMIAILALICLVAISVTVHEIVLEVNDDLMNIIT